MSVKPFRTREGWRLLDSMSREQNEPAESEYYDDGSADEQESPLPEPDLDDDGAPTTASD